MEIKFWFITPIIIFTLLYPSSDESLEECGLIIAHVYMHDDLDDPEFFEKLSIEEEYELIKMQERIAAEKKSTK